MAVKILWYLTAPDGIVPWEPDGRWATSYPQMQQLATTIDRLGYYGGPPRPPLLPLNEAAKTEIDAMLSNLTAHSAHL